MSEFFRHGEGFGAILKQLGEVFLNDIAELVIVLIFWFIQVASTHKQLLPFPYLHMFLLIFTYATMDDISIPWIAQLCLVSKHMFV